MRMLRRDGSRTGEHVIYMGKERGKERGRREREERGRGEEEERIRIRG